MTGCGTRAGFQRHRRRYEPPCQPCEEADRVWMRDYRAANRDRIREYQRRWRAANRRRWNAYSREWRFHRLLAR